MRQGRWLIGGRFVVGVTASEKILVVTGWCSRDPGIWSDERCWVAQLCDKSWATPRYLTDKTIRSGSDCLVIVTEVDLNSSRDLRWQPEVRKVSDFDNTNEVKRDHSRAHG